MASTGPRPDVSLFLPAFTVGGVERMRLNIARGFTKAGFRVELVALNAQGPLLDEVPEGVSVADLNSPRMLTALPSVVRYFRDRRPTVFLSALDYANLVSLWAHRLVRVDTRIYVGTHKVLSVATRETELWREKHLMPTLLRRAYPRADGIIGVSDGIADDLVSFLNLKPGSVTVINNPALTDEVLARAEEPSGHPWLDDPVMASRTVISVGRLDRQKDFPTLIRAFERLRSEGMDLRLVIVGEGKERPHLEALVTELGLEDRISLPGFSTNPWAFMKRAALFVSSSAWEGFGNVHVEALGCGCPVVSTDSPSGPADILDNGRFGPLVPIGDVDALAQAMRKTLERPLPADTLKARAMDFHVDKVIEHYRTLMQL